MQMFKVPPHYQYYQRLLASATRPGQLPLANEVPCKHYFEVWLNWRIPVTRENHKNRYFRALCSGETKPWEALHTNTMSKKSSWNPTPAI